MSSSSSWTITTPRFRRTDVKDAHQEDCAKYQADIGRVHALGHRKQIVFPFVQGEVIKGEVKGEVKAESSKGEVKGEDQGADQGEVHAGSWSVCITRPTQFTARQGLAATIARAR